MDNLFVQREVINGGNEDVIHVYKQRSWVFVLQSLEYAVHGFLEGGRGVGKAKVHHIGLVKAVLCLKGHIPSVFLLDPNVVVSPAYVQSCKKFLSF
jgi:hypothetical protein